MPIHRTIAQAAAICLLALGTRRAAAQDAARPTPDCAPRPGSVQVFREAPVDLYATLVPARDSADAPAMYLATVLQEALRVFAPPASMPKVSDGVMVLWVHGDGRLTNARVVDTLLPLPLANALANALDSLGRRGGVGPVFPRLHSDSVELRLIVHHADQRTPLSIPFLRVVVPPAYFEFQVEKPAMARRGNPSPRYPQELREKGVDGEVLAQFVVDTSGRAETRTLKILKSTHNEFARAVREVVPRMHFFPAELGGCKVRQVVQLPFGFKVGR